VICAVGSFVGGTLSVIGLGLFAPLIASLMLDVGPAAEFLLMLLALVMMSAVGTESRLKTLIMILVGLLISTIGMDQITAHMRFTFGSVALGDGLSFVAVGGARVASDLLEEARQLGEKLARLRVARRIRQADAATRAGISRSTAVLLEKGDLSRTQAQILRYLEAIAPGVSLLSLLKEDDPSLQALAARETTQRVRASSKAELQRLDF
jgi:TctA family transporter